MTHSWRDKIDGQGQQIVEMAAKLRKTEIPKTLNLDEWKRWSEKHAGIYSSYPDLEAEKEKEKRKVTLKPEFIQRLMQTHPEIELNEAEMQHLFEHEEFSLFRAEALEIHQRIFEFFEEDADKRFLFYSALASAFVFLKMVVKDFIDISTRGNKVGRISDFLAQNLQWFAGALRGKVRKIPGRKDVEKASFIDAILKHQTEPLTQVELCEVVKAAGFEISDDPEAFRLWLHRARKHGLVNNYRSTRDSKTEQ